MNAGNDEHSFFFTFSYLSFSLFELLKVEIKLGIIKLLVVDTLSFVVMVVVRLAEY